jgi:hypothetical protein
MKKVALEPWWRMIARISNSLFQTLSSWSLSVWKASALIMFMKISWNECTSGPPTYLKEE